MSVASLVERPLESSRRYDLLDRPTATTIESKGVPISRYQIYGPKKIVWRSAVAGQTLTSWLNASIHISGSRIVSVMSAIEPTPSVNWSNQIVKYSQSLVGDLHFLSPTLDTMNVERNRDKNVEAMFRKLAERWQKETINFSLAYQKTGHEAYKKIVALGWPVVPIILGDLRQKPDLWFDALAAITGEDPIIDHPEIYGDVKAMAQRWIDWGKQKRR